MNRTLYLSMIVPVSIMFTFLVYDLLWSSGELGKLATVLFGALSIAMWFPLPKKENEEGEK